MIVRFKRLLDEAVAPVRATEWACGYDLTAAYREWDEESRVMHYGTGIAVEIPQGYVGLLFPRSSVYKAGLSLSCGVGVIDSDYRGELSFKYYWPVVYSKPYVTGDRVGQLLIVPCPTVEWEEADVLSETSRGVGGYGSTGV